MKTKREQVFEILDKQGYILDQQTFKIFGENWTTVSEYTRQWKCLHRDLDFIGDRKIIEKHKENRKHLVRLEGMTAGSWYRVSKDFYEIS
jgi:ribosomal protein S8